MILFEKLFSFCQWTYIFCKVASIDSPPHKNHHNEPSKVPDSIIPFFFKKQPHDAFRGDIFLFYASALNIPFMDIDHWGHQQTCQDVIYWHDNSCINAKSSDGHNIAEGVGQESDTGGGRSDSDGHGRTLEGVGHALAEVAFVFRDVFALSPAVHDDKNVVSRNSKDDEDYHDVQCGKVCYSENYSVDNLCEWKREKNQNDCKRC
jgi:hypothetical protein